MVALLREERADAGKEAAQAAIGEWILHDLRRTAATGMARLNIAPHVVDRILNHVSGTICGAAAVYNRHAYTEERKMALDVWSRYIASLVRPAPKNVIPPHTLLKPITRPYFALRKPLGVVRRGIFGRPKRIRWPAPVYQGAPSAMAQSAVGSAITPRSSALRRALRGSGRILSRGAADFLPLLRLPSRWPLRQEDSRRDAPQRQRDGVSR